MRSSLFPHKIMEIAFNNEHVKIYVQKHCEKEENMMVIINVTQPLKNENHNVSVRTALPSVVCNMDCLLQVYSCHKSLFMVKDQYFLLFCCVYVSLIYKPGSLAER